MLPRSFSLYKLNPDVHDSGRRRPDLPFVASGHSRQVWTSSALIMNIRVAFIKAKSLGIQNSHKKNLRIEKTTSYYTFTYLSKYFVIEVLFFVMIYNTTQSLPISLPSNFLPHLLI